MTRSRRELQRSDQPVSEAKADATYRVGVDIGGAFTDLILVDTTSWATRHPVH